MDGIELNLDLTSVHLKILALTFDNLAFCLNDELTTERIGHLDQLCRSISTYNKLSNTIAVAEIDESHSAQFSGSLHPTCKHHFFTGVPKTDLTASVSSVIIIHHNML